MGDTDTIGEPPQLVKVWFDGFQYKIIDTAHAPTVGAMRKTMAGKLSVPEEGFDVLLEINSSNGDKSVRKMDEHEDIQQVFDKHRAYSNRLVWRPKSDDTASAAPVPETKTRCAPSKWSEMFKSVDNSLNMIKEGYANLPTQWQTIFKSVDVMLLGVGSPIMSNAEIKYLITKCAAVLLSLPTKQSEPVSPYFFLEDNKRPRSLELGGQDRASLELNFKKFENELIALKESTSSKNQKNNQARSEPDEEEAEIKEILGFENTDTNFTPRGSNMGSDGDEIEDNFEKLDVLDQNAGRRHSIASPHTSPPQTSPTRSRLQDKMHLTLDMPVAVPRQNRSVSLTDSSSLLSTPQSAPYTPFSSNQTPRTPYSANQTPKTPTSGGSSPSPNNLFRVPALTKSRASSASTPSTPHIKWRPSPLHADSRQDNEMVLKIIFHTLQEKRETDGTLKEEDEGTSYEEHKTAEERVAE